MLIPRYWSRSDSEAITPDGKRVPVSAWGGSRTSLADAAAAARATVDRIVDRIRRGNGFPERYSYSERPLREEIVEEYVGPDSELTGAITRNAYGVLVLNTARAAFIDVDVPTPVRTESVFGRLIRQLVGRPVPVQPDGTAEPLQRLRELTERRTGWGARVYRTRSGLRYLLTHEPYEPGDAELEEVMGVLGADPQYRRLCRAQKSFRARLTPKPWRMRIAPPPHRYPWSSPAEARAMREWTKRYHRAAERYATCEFMEALGNPRMHDEVRPFVDLHDGHTRASSGLPLA